MPWLRLGDDSDSHPIVMRVFSLGPVKIPDLDAWERANLVHGFVARCATHSAGHLTDRFVSSGTAMSIGGPGWQRWARDAVKAGYWRAAKVDGQAGFEIVDDPEFMHIRLKAAVEFDRKRDTDRKNPQLTMAVRMRDGDACRYCGLVVNWNDRKGARGGTYDHLDPARRTTADVYVVACRGCNAGREQNPQGYELRPPPADPYYAPKTLEQLAEHGMIPRPGSQPDTAAARPDQDTAPSTASDPADGRTPLPGATRPTGPRAPVSGQQAATETRSSRPPDPQAGGSGIAGSGRDRDRSGSGTGAQPARRRRARRGGAR